MNTEQCGQCKKELLASYVENGVCRTCRDGGGIELSSSDLQSKAKSMPLTTGFSTAAGPVVEEIDVITSECVYGINLFKDLFGGIRDIVGGRAGAHQKVLKDLRQTCLRELRMNAAEVGADAVIGIDLDYSEISGKNGGLLMLVASGTAVKLGPKEEAE